jgi:hypothetical protein
VCEYDWNWQKKTLCYRKIMNTTLFKKCKEASVEYAANKKAWATSNIF